MRRPLLCFSAVFLAALAVTLRGGGLPGLTVAGSVLLFCVVLLRDRRGAGGVLLAGSLAAALALSAAAGYGARLDRWGRLAGETLSFTGWVRERDPYSSRRLTVQGSFLWEGERYALPLDVMGAGEELAPGMWISGSLRVLEAREDGGAPLGVSLLGAAEGEPSGMPAPEGFHPLAKLAALRWELSERLYREAPGEASAVAAAMVFSRDDLIPRPLLEQVGRAGVRHLLVVSGLHMAVAVGWVLAACRLLGLGRRGGSALAILAVWFLAGMAGFSISVLRAAVMDTLFLLGRCLGRRPDGLTSLALAGLLLALLCPPVVFQAGFLLSFSATLGLLLGIEPVSLGLLQGWEKRFGPPGAGVRWGAEALAASFCAQLGAMPVLAAVFGSFTLWGVLTNFLAGPFVTGVILLGGVGSVFLGAGRLVPARLLLAGARGFAGAVILAVRLVCRLPEGTVRVLLPWQLALSMAVPAGVFACLCLCPELPPRAARALRRGAGAALALALLAGVLLRGVGTVVSVDGKTGAVVVAAPGGTLVLDGGEGGYERRMASDQLLLCGARDPVALVRPWDSSPNGTLWSALELAPGAVQVPEDQAPLLAGQYPGAVLTASAERREVVPGVWVSHPMPQLTCVETGGKKLLKCWAGYGIIKKSDLPPDGDLLIDMEGRVYPLSRDLRPGRMPGDMTNLILPSR